MALKDFALTTVSALESELGITPDSETARLERLIHVASRRVVEALGRSQIHYEVDRVESIKSFGSPMLRVELVPLLSVQSLKWTTDAGETSTTIEDSRYAIGNNGHTFGQVVRVGGWWPSTAARVLFAGTLSGTEQAYYEVTYTGGWITPQQEADGAGMRTLPYDIEDAVLLLAARRYFSGATGEAIKSERLMKASVTFADVGVGESGLPQDIEALLSSYMRVAI